MSAINDLVNQIENEELRERIQAELDKMAKQKKFGLVFEEHLPECTPLYDIPVRKGSKVALKHGEVNDIFIVLSIKDDKAICLRQGETDATEYPIDDLVTVAEFGEAIYPCLKPVDTVCNAPDSDLWHTLIEADNYHALQLLEYLYAGKVDCIYIDPPYNTGAKDWKYNNDYVDSSDQYRHSKWLSMMQKRLRIAKKLLNPNDSVLIVTIDEKEYLHLGCVLEEMFPEARIQMVSIQITPQGNPRVQQFYRTNEYAFFLGFGSAQPASLPLDNNWRTGLGENTQNNINWVSLLRTGTARRREDRPNMFYPFFIKNTDDGPIIDSIGDPYLEDDLNNLTAPQGTTIVWPIGRNSELRRWQVSHTSARQLKEAGFLRLGKWKGEQTAVQYLAESNREGILNGTIPTAGKAYDGSFVVADEHIAAFIPGTIWRIPSHDATRSGSQLLSKILSGKRFEFPKSLYATHDAIRFFVANKPNALIVDFFAGSGTTLHAVNLLNAEDDGHRRCILVTNNEVSIDEAKSLTEQGYHPGDEEWEKLGIARYVTWPRTVCSIEGHDVNGDPLKGNYIGSDIPMADGFKANAAYFKLGFLDKNAVALGRQFKEMLPTLWMKAGAYGPCPALDGEISDVLLFPENRFAVLTEETSFPELEAALAERPEIETVYIITDYEAGYRTMAKRLNVKQTYQLYRDYLDNFRINVVRD